MKTETCPEYVREYREELDKLGPEADRLRELFEKNFATPMYVTRQVDVARRFLRGEKGWSTDFPGPLTMSIVNGLCKLTNRKVFDAGRRQGSASPPHQYLRDHAADFQLIFEYSPSK